MKVGIIGSGGREHALCCEIKKSKELNYWNVDSQEAYYSYVEASKIREAKD